MLYSRQEWVKATQFEDLPFTELRNRFLERIETSLQNAKEKKPPVFVFDLDSTLFQVSHRTFQILMEWFDEQPERKSQRALIYDNLKVGDIRYSLEELWADRGLDPEDPLLYSAKTFWRKRFFSHEYLRYDEPMEGALDFVKDLYRAGGTILYLTGRDTPQMGFGTSDQLKFHGFPLVMPRTRLVMKPRRHHDDVQFKSGVCKSIESWGTVLAQFENEPKNFVAIHEALGAATQHVFLDTVSSPHPAKPIQGVYRLKHFMDEGIS